MKKLFQMVGNDEATAQKKMEAVMGFDIPAIHLEHSGASAVILSPVESDKPLDYNLEDVCREDHARVRIFGKPIAHVGRRMGVVVCYDKVGCDMDALRDKTLARNSLSMPEWNTAWRTTSASPPAGLSPPESPTSPSSIFPWGRATCSFMTTIFAKPKPTTRRTTTA